MLKWLKRSQKKRLKEINNLKKKFLKNGSTSLTASQEIYLDAAEAEALTEGMKYTLQEQITDLKKCMLTKLNRLEHYGMKH